MFSISLSSCEVKENPEAAQNLVDEMHDLVGDLGSDSSLSFSEAEQHILQKHAKRPQSKTFREKGYQITSSVIESACQQVVAQRCRRASMRWTDEGLNAILQLRCPIKNKTWEKDWYPDTIAAGCLVTKTLHTQLCIFKIENVTDIQNIQTVCTNSNWTVWHQLKRFFEHYTRDEDARVRWDKKVLEFWIPLILHPNVKQLFIKSTTLYEQHLNRAFPDEEVKVAHLELPSWHKGNKIFQIQTGIYPREMILDYDRNWDVIGISKIGINFYKGIIGEIEKDENVAHAVITYVAGIKQLSEIVKRDNVHLIKFSDNMDNLDSILEKAQVIWIVGSPEPPQGTIWRQGQIIYGNDDAPLNYEKDKDLCLYTDERLQNIYEQNIDVLLRPMLNCQDLRIPP